MKAVSVLQKYCYDLDSSEKLLMHFHELKRAQQFSDLEGKRVLRDEVVRVRNKILEGLN